MLALSCALILCSLGPISDDLRVVDKTGGVPAAELQSIGATLAKVEKERDYRLVVAFVPALTPVETNKLARAVYDDYKARGLHTTQFGVIAFSEGFKSADYIRTNKADELLTLNKFRLAFRSSAGEGRVERVRDFIRLAFDVSDSSPLPGPTPDPKPGPDPKPQPAPTPAGSGSGTVTPAGGVVEAAGASIRFAPGSVTQDEQITVEAKDDPASGLRTFDVKLSSGRHILAAPAELSLPLPAGVDPSQASVAQAIGDQLWESVPTRYDASTGRVVGIVHHFSLNSVQTSGRNTRMIVGATGGGLLGGAGALWVIGNVISGPVGLVVLGTTAVGALAGSLYDDYAKKRGLTGKVFSNGFEVYWDASRVPATPVCYGIFRKSDGRLLFYMKGEEFEASGLPEAMKVSIDGQEVPLRRDEMDALKHPAAVLQIAREAELSRDFYQKAGFPVPEKTVMLIHSDMTGGDGVDGYWDGKYLHVNVASATAARQDERRATIAHEYWHAVYGHNGYDDLWPGWSEATAVGWESLVWAGTQPDQAAGGGFVKSYPFPLARDMLLEGLQVVGEGQDDVKRGYSLWAWPKYLIHRHGLAYYQRALKGEVTGAELDRHWYDFTDEMVYSTSFPSEPLPFPSPFGGTHHTITGMRGLPLPGSPKQLGVHRQGKGAALSLIAMHLTPVDPGVIVARRTSPSNEIASQSERISAYRFTGGIPAKEAVDTGFGGVKVREAAGNAVRVVVATRDAGDDWSTDPVVVYRLAPPASVDVELTSEREATVRFPTPTFAPNTDPRWCVAGYRLFAQVAGAWKVVADLLYDAASLPQGSVAGWYQGTGGVPVVPISPSAEVVCKLDRALVPTTRVFALASLDGVLQENGLPVMSTYGARQQSSVLDALRKTEQMDLGVFLGFTRDQTLTIPDPSAPGGQRVQKNRVSSSQEQGVPAHMTSTEWGLRSRELGGRLSWSDRSFTYSWSGAAPPPSGDGSLEYPDIVYMRYPLNVAQDAKVSVTVSIRGDFSEEGRLEKLTVSVSHQAGLAEYTVEGIDAVVQADNDRETRVAFELRGAEAMRAVKVVRSWFQASRGGSTERSDFVSLDKVDRVVVTFAKP